MHIQVQVQYRSKKKKTLTFFFGSALLDGSETAVLHTQQWERDGRGPMRRNVQSIIPMLVASRKVTPKEYKRGIPLAKRLHLECDH